MDIIYLNKKSEEPFSPPRKNSSPKNNIKIISLNTTAYNNKMRNGVNWWDKG